jgi:hypothetical protein
MLARRDGAKAAAEPVVGVPDVGLLTTMVPLVEFLGQTKWPDGKERRTGTVMLLHEDGVWKAWLHDRAQGLTAWVSTSTLVDLLPAVAVCIEGEGASWRADKGQGQRPR